MSFSSRVCNWWCDDVSQEMPPQGGGVAADGLMVNPLPKELQR